MYLIDYHTHTELSPDSSALLMDNAKAAIAAGLSELCITDHFDLLDEHGVRRRASQLDWGTRQAQLQAVRSATEGKLILRLGIEFGSAQVDRADAVHVLSQPELDFVIGSIHNLSLAAGGTDLYYTNYTSPDLCYQALDDYFSSMMHLVEADCYDVLAHIIYPTRYMSVRDGQKVNLSRYFDQIEVILRGAIQRGRGIELNTWSGRTLEEWRPILERFKAQGGEYITVGSDSHVPGSIGRGIPQAYDLLRDVGLRYVTTYEKRRPIQVKL